MPVTSLRRISISHNLKFQMMQLILGIMHRYSGSRRMRKTSRFRSRRMAENHLGACMRRELFQHYGKMGRFSSKKI